MTCDDYQIALDQRQAWVHSALSAAELDDHVAACAACTAYVSLSRKVAASMMNTISLAPPVLDVDAMRAHVTKFRRQARRALTLWPVVFGAAMLLNRVVVDWPATWTQAVISAVISTAIAYALMAHRTRRHIAELRALEAKSGDEMLAGLRAELDRRVRNERQGWWVLPIVLVAFHWQFVGWTWPSGALLMFELCYLALIPLGLVRYRRAKRERALLDA